MYQLIQYAIDIELKECKKAITLEEKQQHIDMVDALYGKDLSVEDKMYISNIIKISHELEEEME